MRTIEVNGKEYTKYNVVETPAFTMSISLSCFRNQFWKEEANKLLEKYYKK